MSRKGHLKHLASLVRTVQRDGKDQIVTGLYTLAIMSEAMGAELVRNGENNAGKEQIQQL